MTHVTRGQLEAALASICRAPAEEGVLECIVRRPRQGLREQLEVGELTVSEGLVGDSWLTRGSARTPDGRPHPDMQLNVMSSRVIALIAREKERWKLPGDQLFIDLDLSITNLPPGTRLAVGAAVIEVTGVPHTSCKLFVEKFGEDALSFVMSPLGRQLRLRGLNAKVVRSGGIRVGDAVRKLAIDVAAGSDDRVRSGRVLRARQGMINRVLSDK